MSQRYIGGLIYNPPGGFSGYFDGNGDVIYATESGSQFTFGTGDYEYSAWIFTTDSGTGQQTIFGRDNTGNTAVPYIYIQPTNRKIGLYYSSLIVSGTTAIAANQWYYITVSRVSGTSRIFVDGVLEGSAADSTNLTAAGKLVIGGQWTGNTNMFVGYISNARVVKGAGVTSVTVPSGPLAAISGTQLLTCAYGTFRDGSTNNFTITVNGNTAVSTQNPFPLTTLPNPALGNQGNGIYSMSQYQSLLQQNLWPAVDPYWEYVTLMLHGNGTNGAQNNTFLDSSTNNFTITRNGNTSQGTFTPYGSNWSNYFDGTGDYLSVADNAAFEFGSGNFTIEGWINPNALGAGLASIVTKSDGTGGAYAPFLIGRNGSSIIVRMSSTGSSWDIVNGTSFGTLVVGQWMHFALVRNGTSITGYLNGVGTSIATTSASLWDNSNSLLVGAIFASGSIIEFFNGYISNIRLVKGTAVYTSNFTPPTDPLTAITNTSLLTCQSNRFIDNSSNAFTITRNGDVSVQRFSPFNPTASYAAGTIGGSGYFDGSGDYLSFPQNTAQLSNSDFSLEAWVYPTNGDEIMLLEGNTDGTTIAGSSFGFYAQRSGGNAFIFYGGSNIQIAAPAPIRNAWNHIVYARTSGTWSCFLNGARVSTAGANVTVNSGASNFPPSINRTQTGSFYIGGYRFLLGSSAYDATLSTLTVPTTIPTAITNTKYLLNFTNGGIIDNAMMNDLETVGNAQISTSVSKFGGGSISFDGSGDYLLIPNGENFNFGAGNWTIEFWVRFNTVGVRQVILSSGNSSGTSAPFFFELNNSLRLRFLIQTPATGQIYVDTSYTPNANQWYHLAGVRNGSTATFYVDGVSVGSVSPGTNALSAITNQIVIGDYIGLGIPLNGYLDDMRFTKGYARYTANFTPQRSQWQDQ